MQGNRFFVEWITGDTSRGGSGSTFKIAIDLASSAAPKDCEKVRIIDRLSGETMTFAWSWFQSAKAYATSRAARRDARGLADSNDRQRLETRETVQSIPDPQTQEGSVTTMSQLSMDYWRNMVRGACHAPADMSADDWSAKVEEIASIACRAEAGGHGVGVWHAASIVFGNLARCPCYPCSKARGER